ncbi:hypothetical protein [Cellulosilyticum lentocellum]|uniref:Uncharacterized protein n=1 Tax=Cellulosilyticum lentocellum (strain ATCC 49066 / DSM 5427 / NCIMB 11756 / RHM5) TaxID=642492 RepID=F2JQ21_CELLD|nr:hypothetical protein [Cellulosilyticum lentocellum]ADZ82569.1 hypothetical protein Clole_0836 [Cellulosilyticum lentocellum DSM 5427]
MISDASQWVDIELEWSYSSGVTPITNGYSIDNSRIESDTTLTENQSTNKYGVIFIIASLDASINNYCELVFYDSSGSMLNASRTYFNIVEDGKTWIEIDVPHKVSRVEYVFGGKFDVTAIQLYGVSNLATVNVATYESVGTVQPDKFQGVKVEADGRIGVNIGDGLTITADGKVTTTSDLSGSNWTSIDDYLDGWVVNAAIDTQSNISGGYWFKFLSNGDLQYLNGNRTIRCTSHNSNMPTYTPPVEESGTSGS